MDIEDKRRIVSRRRIPPNNEPLEFTPLTKKDLRILTAEVFTDWPLSKIQVWPNYLSVKARFRRSFG